MKWLMPKTEFLSKYLGITFDRQLTCNKHVSLTKVKTEIKIFISKDLGTRGRGFTKICWAHSTRHSPDRCRNTVQMYGMDASRTNLKKLETIENHSLTTCLWVIVSPIRGMFYLRVEYFLCDKEECSNYKGSR